MNGDVLINRIRTILKDNPDSTRQGQFWDVKEIVLALNASQDIFVNYCINNKLNHLISSLLVNTGYLTHTFLLPNIALPVDYLHYASGRVGPDINNLRLARVYIGGTGETYRPTSQDAIIILRNSIQFRVNGTLTGGVLYYYKTPSFIGDSITYTGVTDFSNQDFNFYIYRDIIAQQAAVLLAMKEVQTQRDFKKYQRTFAELALQPKELMNYAMEYDKSIQPIMQGAGNVSQ